MAAFAFANSPYSTTDFTNVLKKSQIERLAEADEHELVREVQVSSPALGADSALETMKLTLTL